MVEVVDERRLSIYLNDHLAGSSAGVELAKRCARSNSGNEFGDFLERLGAEIEEDRRTLEQLMDRLGIKRNVAKSAAGWAAEKFGRLKLNGQLVGYSPLSRLVEFEGLALGIGGKSSMWKSLKTLSEVDSRIDAAQMDRLIERAQRQAGDVEAYRRRAISAAFT